MRCGLGAVAALTLLGALALPACSRSDATPPSRTVRPAPSTSPSTTTLEQSYAVPDVIDAAYVNRVLAALEKVAGDVVRKIHATGEFTEEDLIPLRAIYNDPEFEIQAELFQTLVGEASAQRDPPGDNEVTVQDVLAATAQCVYVSVQTDVSPTVIDPPPPRTSYLELRPTQPGADPKRLNPTPWSISVDDETKEARCGS